ncbi:YcbK family protein [Pantoea sp. Nvir]|uniref:YcbK family protein n=1 Tax=Pantoea sp. Nvir TaxID=2576760 RepID=UPI001356D2B6|nr:YcbK family protein [Pantoea sp. Nvir]MXP66280.1 DUF882 domain-containing protein [Pantoea sp. Nvir]CAJ0991497.1 hypothetical protein NVIRPANT_00281 [Pantoea sp. Nvir]
MDCFNLKRRKLLIGGTAALSMALLPNTAKALLTISHPRSLTMSNLHTGETLRTEFFNGKHYDQNELTRLNYFFRDYRANLTKSIDPSLFDQIYLLQTLLETRKTIQLISGYRSLVTNNILHNRSSGVAKHSYHTKGRAMDFYIEGVKLSDIRKIALKMCAGGVGYYPRSNFVHIDTGPVRHW